MKHSGLQQRPVTLIQHLSRFGYRIKLLVRLVVCVTELFRYLHQLHFCSSLDNFSVTKTCLRFDVSLPPLFALKVINIYDELLKSAHFLDLWFFSNIFFDLFFENWESLHLIKCHESSSSSFSMTLRSRILTMCLKHQLLKSLLVIALILRRFWFVHLSYCSIY